MNRGFTLIQISILLIAASLVLVAILPSTRTTLNANNATTAKLNSILTAMRGYEAKNAALPCPADASQPTQSTSYGVAAANPGTGSPGNCTGGTPAANYVDTTNNVAVGMVPVRALGLSNDYALDAYGRDITYAVDTNATVCFSGTLPGKITVTDNGTAHSTIAALVSHGTDGHGAWVPLTGSSGSAVRLNAGSTDSNTLLNAHVNGSFTPYTPLTNFVRSPPTATFDDLLVYKSNLWTLNAAPAASAVLLPTLTGPASGSYYTGQTLSFSVAFSSAATVTGTPELTLSIPQSSGSNATRYAAYASGSGTTTLTFTYTVQSTDYAPSSPSSVSMTSPIVLNGGSISVGGATPCLTFTPPSLTGVLLNPTSVWVADYDGYRVERFSTSGTYLSQIGCSSGDCAMGTGNGQFGGTGGAGTGQPQGMKLDANNNLWVNDDGNYRIQEFSSSSGAYMSQLDIGDYSNIAFDASGNIWGLGYEHVYKYSPSGTLLLSFGGQGTTGGKFSNCTSAGITVDSNGHVWVTDCGNNRVQEFNSSGTYLGQLGCSSGKCTAGSGNGQLSSPNDIAIDGGGNLWIVDSGNYRVEELNSSGTFLLQFPCSSGACAGGTGNGQFIDANFIAIDSGGNVWVTDSYNANVNEFTSCGVYVQTFGGNGTANGQFNQQSTGIAISPGPAGGGGACVASLTPPSNGAYTTGQTLTFTVTYNQAVTVTGSPQLVLTIGSNTRYANYVSGSGTSTLTFTYTIQSSDVANSGISVASSVSLNGGTITTTSDGVAANTGYTAPSMGGIDINATQFILVADTENNRIQKLDLLGNFVDQFPCASGACTAGSGNGSFNYGPYDLAVDGSGNIWVTDPGNCRVQKFNSAGVFQMGLGAGYNGVSGSVGSCGSGNGQFRNNQLGTNQGVDYEYVGADGIAIDGSGNVWVVDNVNFRVQEFSSSGTYKGQLGTGTAGCTAGMVAAPQYVHFDSSGNVYVADAQCGQIEEFSSSGTYIKTIGNAIPGYSNGNGGDTLSAGDFDDFAFDACGNIWMQDEGNGNLVQTDYAGNYLQAVNLYNVSGGIMGGMQSIAISSGGTIYSLDESPDADGGDDIAVLNSSGAYQTVYGYAGQGSGNGQFLNANGMTLEGSVPTRLPITNCPAVILSAAGPTNGTYTTGGTLGFAVTYDQAVTVNTTGGTPYISVTIGSNTRQAAYISGSGTTTLTFQYTVVAGDNAQSGITMNVPISLNGGTITTSSNNADVYFQPPTLTGVLVNPASYSNFYIADTSNHRVRKVTASTGYISTVAGTGTSGAFTAGAATSSKLNAPNGVALDGSGNLYIADTGDHAVAKVNTSGTLSYFAGTGTSGTVTAGAATSSKLNSPAGVAFDGSGNAYIADSGNHEVLKVNTSGTLSVFAGTGTSGTITAGTAASSKLNSPTGVVADSSGNVYIADGGNHEVLKVNTSGTLSVFAGTGSSGSTHENDGSLATAAKLKTPYGVAVDSSNNIYIADSGNDVILEVTASTGKIAILTGTVGTASYTGDNGAATSATESAAEGVAVDSSGNVYIADTGNNLVRWIVTVSDTISPIAGNGTAGYSGDGAAATSAEINAPAGVAVSR